MPIVDAVGISKGQTASACSDRLVLVASRISVAERIDLATLAHCHDRTVSREIRRAIRDYIAHHQQEVERTVPGHDPATEAATR
jgi:hypothetical protein